jgi:hypothetical protein
VDDARLRRYLRQAATASLTVRPKLRRGQDFDVKLEVSFRRLGADLGDGRLRGRWWTSPLTIGGLEVLSPLNAGQTRDETLVGSSYHTTGSLARDRYRPRPRRTTTTTATTAKGSPRRAAEPPAEVPLGAASVQGTLKATLTLREPVAIGPETLELPFSAPVEIVPEDALTDVFAADPAQRDAVRAALLATRVTHNDKGQVDVRFKVDNLPVPVAAAVFVVQGGAEQRVGTALLEAGRPARWQAVWSSQKPKFTGTVDVHLRPDQSASERLAMLGTYWGEPVVIEGVVVDAPYVPPFNNDESLRPAVEAALTGQRPRIVRRPKKPGDASVRQALRVNVEANSAPVKLAYRVILRRADGVEQAVEQSWVVPAKAHHGSGMFADDFDPAGGTKRVDLVFRPDRDWERHSYDVTPPWGGEVIVRDVPIVDAKPGEED